MIIACFYQHRSLLELSSQILGLTTPFILLSWFCYTQYKNYLKTFCKELIGVYAGFVDSSRNFIETNEMQAGIIMYIKDIDDKGYFKGEFEYGEIKVSIMNNIPIQKPLSVGLHNFLGKLNYQFYWDKIRHPLKPKENRVYNGKFYILTRFDFLFESIPVEEYLHAEYDVVYYRELKLLQFTVNKSYKKLGQKLPEKFTLYKSFGLSIDPLKGVNDVVFEPMKNKLI